MQNKPVSSIQLKMQFGNIAPSEAQGVYVALWALLVWLLPFSGYLASITQTKAEMALDEVTSKGRQSKNSPSGHNTRKDHQRAVRYSFQPAKT